MDLTNLQQLVPAVAVTIILTYALIRKDINVQKMQERSEQAHESKTVSFLKALKEKDDEMAKVLKERDDRFSEMVNGQFAKSNAIIERMTSVLEKIDTKISWTGTKTKIRK